MRRSSEENKSFIHSFGVIPEFRYVEIEEKLIETVMVEFEKHGLNLIRAWTGVKRNECLQPFERLDFKPVYRTFSWRSTWQISRAT